MKQQRLKQIIKKMPLYSPLRNWLTKRKQKKELREWERTEKPEPSPHIIKQQTLLTYARRFRLKNLVETGTLYGDMVEAMKNDFDRIYSIELSTDYMKKQRKDSRKKKT